MSTSNEPNRIRLEVRTERPEDSAAEIFVIDGQFQLADRGVGRLTSQLDPGIYTVKCRVGVQTWEQHVILRDSDKEVVIPPLDFTSPAPLVNTAKTHEYHMAEAAAHSQTVHFQAGQGSWIFVFARDWTAQRGDATRPPIAFNPARGLSLKDMQGTEVAALENSAAYDLARDPWAACNVQVNPGLYRLSLETPAGARLEQTIVASPGWQTQIFLLQRAYSPEPDDRRADLPGASILMSRGQGFTVDRSDFRQAELARLGLTNQRRVLSEEVLKLLQDKFQNPMLGIYGAHLLLLDSQPNLGLLDHVVTNLRALLDAPHPDVEALALRLEPRGTPYIFHAPPMLRESWALVVEATATRADLVPLGSLAASISDRIWGEEPWLLWMENGADTAADLEELLESRLRPLERAARAPDPTKGFDLPFDVSAERTMAVERDVSAAPESLSLPRFSPRDAEDVLRARLDDDRLKRLVHTLGLPRATVEQLVEKVARKMKGER
jgi:hypothetical protein